MANTYYQYEDVKRRIVHRLFQLEGWQVYGWSPDRSDGMTDYYDPESWDGLAEKNGYRLVIDHDRAAEERRYTVRTCEQAVTDSKIRDKIAKLEEMTQARGATPGEEAAAKRAIAALLRKSEEAEADDAREGVREIICPGHLANPPRCNWHIEKDGIIIDKGTGLLKFSDVPDITADRELKDWQRFNTMTPEHWKSAEAERLSPWYSPERIPEVVEYNYRRAQEQYVLLERFNVLINRWNTTCGGMVGNTDDFYTYEEVTETEYKTEVKPRETSEGDIREGQHFIIKGSFNYGICKGYVYIIHAHEGADGKTWFTANRLNRKHTKELTGTANTANHFGFLRRDRFQKWLDHGAVAWCELEEVRTPYEVKKVLKKKVGQTSKTAAQKPVPAAAPQDAGNPEKPAKRTAAPQKPDTAPDSFTVLAAAFIRSRTGKPVSQT